MIYTDLPDNPGGPFYDGRDISLRPNLYKGGSAPKPNKKLERLQEEALRKQIKAANQKVEMPHIEVPPPAPPPPPPPTASSADAEDAAAQARQAALRRKGIASTLLAGNYGGYQGSPLGGNRTLLG